MLRLLRIVPLLLLLACSTQAWAASRTLKGNETWSGIVRLNGDIIVPANATLTIQPGTEILFPPASVLAVEGRLLARGSAKNPIIMHAASPDKVGAWQGISLDKGPQQGSELLHVQIDGAAQGIILTGAKVHIADTTIRRGTKGIASGGGAFITIERVAVSDMSEGGIDVSVGSQGKITDCQLRRLSGFGIQIGKKSVVAIRNNLISEAKFGIFVSGNFPPMEGNSIDHCEVGIAILQTNPNSIVKGNKLKECKSGIACHQFAAPTIEKNTIEGCELGIEAFQASSPVIRNNRLTRNQRAISCVQMCNPLITRNDLIDNKTAIYLHLSSYAQIHDNNFEGNRLHVELDNMSSDWEVRAKKKPTRNREKQSEVFVQQGKANPQDYLVDAGIEGFVNAKDNFWGKEASAEMAAKGTNANISTIQDAYDIPTRTYDGWPGVYKQDRVRYDGWKKVRISGTFTP